MLKEGAWLHTALKEGWEGLRSQCLPAPPPPGVARLQAGGAEQSPLSWHADHSFPAAPRLTSLTQKIQLPKGWWLKWSHEQPKFLLGSFYSQQKLSQSSQENSGSDSADPNRGVHQHEQEANVLPRGQASRNYACPHSLYITYVAIA